MEIEGLPATISEDLKHLKTLATCEGDCSLAVKKVTDRRTTPLMLGLRRKKNTALQNMISKASERIKDSLSQIESTNKNNEMLIISRAFKKDLPTQDGEKVAAVTKKLGVFRDRIQSWTGEPCVVTEIHENVIDAVALVHYSLLSRVLVGQSLSQTTFTESNAKPKTNKVC